MIDLSQIGDRIGKGIATVYDLQLLLAAARADGISVDSEHFDKGLGDARDLQELYDAIQNTYADKYGRQTDAANMAAVRAKGEAARVAADAKRKADSLVQFQAEQKERADRIALAQAVADAQTQAVAVQGVVDRFNAAKAAADKILEEKHKVAESLNEALNG